MDHACENNATCVDGAAEYTCQCSYGFNGELCEIVMGTYYFFIIHKYTFKICDAVDKYTKTCHSHAFILQLTVLGVSGVSGPPAL